MDLNIYNLHFVSSIMGYPEHVRYYARKHENGIDLGGTIILDYPKAKAICSAAKDVVGDSRIQIIGENGYILVEDGVNGKKAFDITIGNETIHYDIDDEKDRFVNEFVSFEKIYEARKYDEMKKLLNHTCWI